MPASELIGEEYFSKTPNNTGEGEVFADKVTRKELKALQTEIATVIRPPYCQGPPSNLGNPGHGKLKADQWKTCMEFDLPIFIAQNWARETSAAGQDPEITARRDKVSIHKSSKKIWSYTCEVFSFYILISNSVRITTQASTSDPS
jgi:hypothetical protein